MSKLILWLLFLGRGDLTRGEVNVQWPPHLPNCETHLQRLAFILLAFAAIGVVVHFYRREPDYVAKRRKHLLSALRAAGLLTLLFVLTGAYLEVTRTDESLGTLILLLDNSQSMGIVDRRTQDRDRKDAATILGLEPGALTAADRKAIDNTSRAELVKKALANPKLGLLHALGDRFKVEAFTFGQTAQVSPLALPRTKEGHVILDAEGGPLAALGVPDEPATQLGSALRDAVRRHKGQHIIGIVLVTDGASNRGEAPVITAEDLGVPIYPVGVGLPQAKDIEVPFLFVENVVFKGDTFPIYVRVKQRGYDRQSARLIIERDGEVIREKTIEFGDEAERTHVVEITPQEEGTFTYAAKIEPFADEMNTENNSKAKPGIRVIDKKIQVLLVEDAPRWEYRFLKGVLEADNKRIELTIVLRQADEDLIRQPGGRFRALFPETPEELRPFNLVILGNIVSEFFTEGELKNLEHYVRAEGGALLIIAGHNHMPDSYEGSPLEDLLPVQFSAQPEYTAEDEVLSSITIGFRPTLTPEGKRSRVLRFAVDPLENESLWERVGPLYWFYPAERLKPGATALLVHPTQTTRHGPMPLVAVQRYGKGQVLYFGIDETWRWRYKPGSEYHRKLWGQAISMLSMAHLLGKTNRIQIDTDRTEYAVGEKVKIIARVLDEGYNNLAAASVTAVVERGDLEKEEVVLTAQQEQPGVFQGEFIPAVEGRFRVTIKGEEEETEHLFAAVTPRIEFDDPGMRRELLQQVADASGGAFVYLHELDRLAEKLKARRHTVEPRREERTLWNAPGIVILFTLLLGLEWFIRKRSDLL